MTDNHSSDGLLPVIQADRDAAAAHWFRTVEATDENFAVGHHLRIGEADHNDLVQAFARHRITALTPTREADGPEPQAAEGEVIFTIRVRAGATQVHTNAGKHVFPAASLEQAIQALGSELTALARCPAHRAPTTEAVADGLLKEALQTILLLLGDLRFLTTAEDRKPLTGEQRAIDVGTRIDAALQGER